MTIGTAALIYYISLGAMMEFSIDSISSTLRPLDVFISARQAWGFVYWSGGERGRRCVLLKQSWVMEADENLKD